MERKSSCDDHVIGTRSGVGKPRRKAAPCPRREGLRAQAGRAKATVTSANYYQADLAWVRHAAYSRHVRRTCAGIVRLLHDEMSSRTVCYRRLNEKCTNLAGPR